tara:strand:- start:403 stop:567 length:165 start_codon:yes stop_codon:yes gene_type:complete
MSYKLQKDSASGKTESVVKTIGSEKTWIPFDPQNRDYQEYLEWVAAGNTAEAAD